MDNVSDGGGEEKMTVSVGGKAQRNVGCIASHGSGFLLM